MSSNDSSFLRNALQSAVKAALQAGAYIRYQSGRLQQNQIKQKGKNDLVTEADVESQRMIMAHLSKDFPEALFLGEEEDQGANPEMAIAEQDLRWIIDPIDGTTNFIHGIPHFAVSIGLQAGQEMVAGVIYNVARDELFTAFHGGGAFLNGVPIRVSQTPSLSESVLLTAFPGSRPEQVNAYMDLLKDILVRVRGLRRSGSASLDMAYVACGRIDGFFEAGLHPWDMAAGAVILQEAGGTLTDYHGNDNAVFSRQVVATNGRIQEELLGLVAPMKNFRG